MSSSVSSLALPVKAGAWQPSEQVLSAYVLFLGFAGVVYHFVAEGEFSVVITLSGIVHCLAVLLLVLQSWAGAAGISARSLGLEALALGCRLSSTLWLNGYLPVDVSGDYLFQLVDLCTLGLLLALLHRVMHAQRKTCEEADDSFPVGPIILGSLLGGALLHADMNARPLFDALWMAGFFMGVLAVLPQLWLISKSGGQVEALTGHYIAMTAVSRILSGCFMWAARFDITCKPWVDGVEHASWAILTFHVVHLLLLADFGFYYCRSIAKSGLACAIDVSDMV